MAKSKGVKTSDALTEPQLKAAELVYYGQKNHAQIAHEVGVSTATLSNWKVKKKFKDAVDGFGKESKRKSSRILMGKKEIAAQVMVSLMGSDLDHIKLQAAKEILGYDHEFGEVARIVFDGYTTK